MWLAIRLPMSVLPSYCSKCHLPCYEAVPHSRDLIPSLTIVCWQLFAADIWPSRIKSAYTGGFTTLYVPLAVYSVKRNFVFGKKVDKTLKIRNPFRVRLVNFCLREKICWKQLYACLILRHWRMVTHFKVANIILWVSGKSLQLQMFLVSET